MIWGRAEYSYVLERIPSPSDWYHLQRATDIASCMTGRSTQRVRQEIKLSRYDDAIGELRKLLDDHADINGEMVRINREHSAENWREWIADTGIRIPNGRPLQAL